MRPNELNETLDRFDGWIIDAGRLEASLRKGGQLVLADHMKSIVDDLVFDRFETVELNGPVVIHRAPSFPSRVPSPRFWNNGVDRYE